MYDSKNLLMFEYSFNNLEQYFLIPNFITVGSGRMNDDDIREIRGKLRKDISDNYKFPLIMDNIRYVFDKEGYIELLLSLGKNIIQDGKIVVKGTSD